MNESREKMPQPAITEFFYDLTPDRILDAVETVGVRATGRVIALNSMENRVFEVEVEVSEQALQSPSDRFRVIKFYRPGRWSEAQLQDEHIFLNELDHLEVPVVPALQNASGCAIQKLPDIDIFFAVFPKAGGRMQQELSPDEFRWIGRLLGRLHGIGRASPAHNRPSLTPLTYGEHNIQYLLSSDVMPETIKPAYEALAKNLCAQIHPLFEGIPSQRIHGDCHLGNILWASNGPRLVDFDDMVMGPVVQDIWLLFPGRLSDCSRELENFLEGYDMISPFPRNQLRLVEALRALRLIHYSAWIARRWQDPAFPRAFPFFGGNDYWREQMGALQDQSDTYGENSELY